MPSKAKNTNVLPDVEKKTSTSSSVTPGYSAFGQNAVASGPAQTKLGTSGDEVKQEL